MKATIIIPNYNGLHFMKPCMDALDKQTSREFQILVVDNASADGSVEWMQKEYPEIPLMVLDQNYGFSGAVNRGIQAADTPYVILLNNDTEPEPEYVEELIKTMEADSRIFSASSKMIQLYHKDLIDDAGDLYNMIGWGFQRGVGQSSNGYTKSCRIFSACAGAAIYRREVFETIGYFDELHFAYLEDIDVGYRAQIYGYKNVYCPTAKVYHVGSGTSGSKYNAFKVKLAARNSVYLNYKNMPFLQLLVNALPLALGYLLKAQFFKGIGYAKEYREGLKEGFRTLSRCKKVKFSLKHTGNYLLIEWQLIKNMFIYAYEYGKRKL